MLVVRPPRFLREPLTYLADVLLLCSVPALVEEWAHGPGRFR